MKGQWQGAAPAAAFHTAACAQRAATPPHRAVGRTSVVHAVLEGGSAAIPSTHLIVFGTIAKRRVRDGSNEEPKSRGFVLFFLLRLVVTNRRIQARMEQERGCATGLTPRERPACTNSRAVGEYHRPAATPQGGVSAASRRSQESSRLTFARRVAPHRLGIAQAEGWSGVWRLCAGCSSPIKMEWNSCPRCNTEQEAAGGSPRPGWLRCRKPDCASPVRFATHQRLRLV